MKNRSQKIRLGIFIFISLFTLIALIVFFTTQQLLQAKDTYYIAYKDISVSGLEVGSPVKYLGLKVGVVDDITIDPDDVSRIIVEISVEPGTPIKKDARAEISAIGITGLKMIEIRGGSKQAKLQKPGTYIPAGASITEQITGKAEIIAEKLEKALNNIIAFTDPENLNSITTMADNVSHTFLTADTILMENRYEFRRTIENLQLVTNKLDTTILNLQLTSAKINQLVGGDTLAQILVNTRDVLAKFKEVNLAFLIQEMELVAEQTNRLLLQMDSDLERSSNDFTMSMRQLKNTLDNLNQASEMIQQDPSILIRGTKLEDIPDEELDG